MPFIVLAFLCGDLFLQLFAHLPKRGSALVFMASVILFVLVFYKHWRLFYLPCAFILGFAWSFWYASLILVWELPKEWESKPLVIKGYIDSLPVQSDDQRSFIFLTQSIAQQKMKVRIKLNWQYAPNLRVGEKWQLTVKLKRIHGMQNPGSFDYEAWALESGLRANGYVITGAANSLLKSAKYHYPIQQFRQILQEKIKHYAPHSTTSPWLSALIIGVRDEVEDDAWRVLRNTGTNHLMAIAGLHIGIISTFTHFFVAWCWRRMGDLPLYYPAQLAGVIAGLLMGVTYGMLAGFSLPAQRACTMLVVFSLFALCKRQANPWHVWSFALLSVLIINPLSVLTESFWLSFLTIALIIYGMHGRLHMNTYWWKWGRAQWVIGVGLIPISLLFFQECSVVSFVANTIAIPFLSFFILPFCFLSGIFLLPFPLVGKCLLLIADKSLSIMWLILAYFSHLHFATWHYAIWNIGVGVACMLVILLLLAPAGLPGKWFASILFFPLFFYQPQKPNKGDYWVTLLDVGQGLSIVVQTNTHTLVYDAGAKYNTNFDMGEMVVLPYLRILHANKIDMLVISHGDNDHLGGAQALRNALPILQIKTSVPNKMQLDDKSLCLAGTKWQWDEVNFQFLYPGLKELNLGNDSSCVLKIDNGKQAILLTGDIEKFAEKNLVTSHFADLSANLIIAPHHGSKTSGVKSFIHAVSPQYVLYATGYRNRYHFPHVSVVHEYENIKAAQLNTVDTGAILLRLTRESPLIQIEKYREAHKRYWYEG